MIWTGYVIYLINDELGQAAGVFAAEGIGANVGAGAWLTLVGALAICRAALWHESTAQRTKERA